jgi:hypothetical protein
MVEAMPPPSRVGAPLPKHCNGLMRPMTKFGNGKAPYRWGNKRFNFGVTSTGPLGLLAM